MEKCLIYDRNVANKTISILPNRFTYNMISEYTTVQLWK